MYERTQRSILVSMSAAVAGVAMILASGASGQPIAGVALLFGGVIMVIVSLVFRKLRVAVTSDHVEVAFGLRSIRRRIPISEIVDAYPVRNPWWYGWGIRLTPRGWMWNLYGRDAVEVVHRNRTRFRIGTDDPEGLATAIRSVAAAAA